MYFQNSLNSYIFLFQSNNKCFTSSVYKNEAITIRVTRQLCKRSEELMQEIIKNQVLQNNLKFLSGVAAEVRLVFPFITYCKKIYFLTLSSI